MSHYGPPPSTPTAAGELIKSPLALLDQIWLSLIAPTRFLKAHIVLTNKSQGVLTSVSGTGLKNVTIRASPVSAHVSAV